MYDGEKARLLFEQKDEQKVFGFVSQTDAVYDFCFTDEYATQYGWKPTYRLLNFTLFVRPCYRFSVSAPSYSEVDTP